MKHFIPLTTLSVAIFATTGCLSITSKSKGTPPPTPTVTTLNSTHTLFDAKQEQTNNPQLQGNALNQIKLTINGKESPATLDLMSLPAGFNVLTTEVTAKTTIDNKEHNYERSEGIVTYKQANSTVANFVASGNGAHIYQSDDPYRGLMSNSNSVTANLPTSIFYITGNATDTLPTTSTIHYVGKSFQGQLNTLSKDNNNNAGTSVPIGLPEKPIKQANYTEGTFNYTINFTKKEGFGSATLGKETIDLKAGKIIKLTNQHGFTGYGIQPTNIEYNIFTDQPFEVPAYTLGIFGKNAEEVAGVGTTKNGLEFGFAGTKK